MSDAIKAVVGVVLIVVGAVTSWAGGETLISVGISLLLSAAADALLVKASHLPPLAGISVNYAGTLEPRRLIYGGPIKVGGLNVIAPWCSGSNNDYIHQVLAFAGEPINGITDIYFNQIRIASADIGGLPTGLVGGTGPYNGKAWLRRYDGTQTTVDNTLTGTFASWDSTHVGNGIPYLAAMLQWDQNVYSAGFPQITALLTGKKIYDPRLDSTNGGSGAQRYTTPSTWTLSNNPALVLRDYLTSSLGLGEAQTRIDDTLVAAAANVCDQTCSVPIPVLVGLTNWTNGSNQVTGINTSFTTVLGSGYYLKAPNGTMVQISGSPTDDTHLTLVSNYAGATASAQVTQYNSTNATSTTQPRYTCTTVLDATATFNANIAQLAGAMMGYCVYSAGKWRMYAGAWSGSAFTLGPDDIVGTVAVQCGTPRQSLYNAVRGNFIDPQQNYTPQEFPPITNSTYAAADGETIFVETNFSCCTDRFEAQRNAIIFNRQGRNQKTVTVQYGMSAFGVKTYETGTVTIPEIGWNAQTVRCTKWRFTPTGIVELTLQEAYSADFTDPLATDYALTGINVGNPAGQYLPYPPTGLAITPVPGGMLFQVTLPTQVAPGTTIELWEYTASSPFSSATKIAEGTSSSFAIGKTDTITRYYWVRTKGANNRVSSTFPASTGQAGASLDASNEFVPTGLCFCNSDYAVKVGGSSAWDSSAYTIQTHATCHITAKLNATSDLLAFGLTDTPIAGVSYTNIEYAWYNNSGTWQIYESGTLISSQGSSSLGDIPAVTYDGSTVTYLLNGQSKRTVSTASRNFYGQASFNTANSSLNTMSYGPTTSLKVSDTGQISANAATDTLTASQTNFTLTNNAFSGLCSLTVGPYPYASTVVLTSTGQLQVTTGANAETSLNLRGSGNGTGAGTQTTFYDPKQTQAVSTTVNSGFAMENTVSLGAGVTATYFCWVGFFGAAFGTTSGKCVQAVLKAEVIKR